MNRTLLSWAGGLLIAVASLGGTWLHGRNYGANVEREKALVAENTRVTAIAAAVGETVARSNALAVEVERLRARPERVRTITKEIRVEADADCRSLPESFGLLWNADPDTSPPAGAAPLGDAGRVPVATPVR